MFLIAGAASDLRKLKSNPDGNLAIGFLKGYINVGRYAIIVPEGDVEASREIVIKGPDVKDSVYMKFNTFTMVFSDWGGLFMLGERVYTDEDGVLYFSNEDQCTKKVYQPRGDKVMVVDSDKLDKSECYLVRAKVEKALNRFLTTPFRYMLSHPSIKLQHTPGFPGGDYITGVTYGLVHCGQHTVELPPGDAEKERVIKVTAPGVSEGISLQVDSRTKIYGSWNGYFYLGDKVFSMEPRTLVIEKSDGSCVKKVYEKQGTQIVVAEAKLLKQEDCFLIKSTVFEAFQKLIGPPRLELTSTTDREDSPHVSGKINKIDQSSTSSSRTGAVQLLSENPQPSQLSQPSQPSQQAQPPPIHVTSTVVVPPPSQPVSQVVPLVSSTGTDNAPNFVYTGNQIDSTSGQMMTVVPDNMQLMQQGSLGKGVYLSADSLQSPTGSVILQPNGLQQLNDASQLGQMVYLQSNDIDSSQQNMNVVGRNYPALSRQSGNSYNNEMYLSGNSLNDPSNTIVLVPSDSATQTGQILSTQPSNNIVNIQTNGIQPESMPLQTVSSPFTLQTIDPNQQLGPIQGAVRFARSIGLIKKPVDSEIVNFQKNSVDLDHTGKVSNIQINDVTSKGGPVLVEVPEHPNMEVSGTIRVPAGNSIDSVLPSVLVKVDSLDPSLNAGKSPVKASAFAPKLEASGKVRNTRSIPLSVIGKTSDSEVVNYQKNTVDLDRTRKVSNVQINDVSSKGSPVVVAVPKPTTVEVSGTVRVPARVSLTSIDNSIDFEDPTDVPSLEASGKVRFARSVPLSVIGKSSDSEVVNFQKNTVDLENTRKVSNVQINDVSSKGSPVVVAVPKPPTVEVSGAVRVPASASLSSIDNSIDLEDPTDVPSLEASGKVRFTRSVPLSVIGKSSDSEVVNFQKNTVDVDSARKVSNVQINDVSSKGSPIVVAAPQPPTVEVSGTVRVPGSVDLSNAANSIDTVKAKINSFDHSSTKVKVQGNVVLENDDSLEDPNDAPSLEASGKIRIARSVPLSIIGKSSDSEVVNYQKNTVDLDSTRKVSNVQINDVAAKVSPIVTVFDTAPETVMHGSVRIGRSVSGTYQEPKVLNSQVTNVDGSAINPNKPTMITSVQGNNILAPNGPNGVPIMPDMKATQVTTVTIPPNPSTSQAQSASQGNQLPQKLFINSNVILDQDTSRQNQARPVYSQVQSSQTNGLGSQTKYLRLASTRGAPTLLRLVPTLVSAATVKSQTTGSRSTPQAVSFVQTGDRNIRDPAMEVAQTPPAVVNMQTNKVAAQGQSVSNIQLNDLAQGGPTAASNVLLRQPAILKSVVPTGVLGGTGGSMAFNRELKHTFSGTLSKSGDLNVALNLQSRGTAVDKSKLNLGELDIPGKVPVSLLLNPDNLILNIAENTNFHKKKKK